MRRPGKLEIERKVIEKEFGEPEVREIARQYQEWVIDYEMPILKGEDRKYGNVSVNVVIFVMCQPIIYRQVIHNHVVVYRDIPQEKIKLKKF